MADHLINGVRRLLGQLKSKKGQTLAEYALILAFISVLTISVMIYEGNQIRNLYLPIISALSAARQAI